MPLADNNIELGAVSAHIEDGTNNLGRLCTSAKINKWSEKKPVRVAGGGGADWYLQDNCGMAPPVYTTASAAIAAMDADTAVWGYNQPRGGAAEPYALGHFRGYNHTATPFVSGISITSLASVQGTIKVREVPNSIADAWSVKLENLHCKGYYTALLLKKNSDGTIRWLTTTTSIATAGLAIDLSAQEIGIGEYTGYVVLSKYPKTFAGTEPSNNEFVVFPCTAKGPVKVQAASANYDLEYVITFEVLSRKVTYEIKLTNKTAGTITFTDLTLDMRKGSTAEWSPLVSSELSIPLGTQRVLVGTSVTLTGDATVPGYEPITRAELASANYTRMQVCYVMTTNPKE